MAAVPAYKKVYQEIKNQIRNGTFEIGSLLPTEPELEKMFSVSRTTIRKAISMLSEEGYLNVQQGRGTQVMDVSTMQRLTTITSISETLKEKGYTVSTQGMYIDRIPAPDDVASVLKIRSGTEVFRMQRVQCANEKPIAIMKNYLLCEIAPDLDKYTGQFSSLYDFLERKYDVVFKDATETIYAMAADFNEAQILRIPMESPLICSRRVTNDEQGPFEYAIIKLIADKYEYSVYLNGRKHSMTE